MHTVEMLEQAMATAEKLGFQVRQEWLGGIGGGACEFGGQKWVFVDLALSTLEQLEQVSEAIRDDPGFRHLSMSDSMRKYLEGKSKAA